MISLALSDRVLLRALTARPEVLRVDRSAALLDKNGLLWWMAGR